MNIQALLISSLVTYSSSAYASTPHDFLHFSIELPKGYSLVDISPKMMDFNIYAVHNSKKVIIGRLYVGNHASTRLTPTNKRSLSKTVTVAMAEYSIKSLDYELLLEFDGLKYKGEPNSPWSSIQLFNVTTNPSVRNLLISSVKSVSVVRPNIESVLKKR